MKKERNSTRCEVPRDRRSCDCFQETGGRKRGRRTEQPPDPLRNILPEGTDPQTAVDILAEHFLGHPIITGYPASNAQWNTEVVNAILRIYPRGSIRRIRPRFR